MAVPTSQIAVTEAHAEALRTAGERLKESGRFHAGTGKVHRTIRVLASDLSRMRIPYAVIGGMALNAHGYRRQTTDVDILVTSEGLAAFRDRSPRAGYYAVPKNTSETFVSSSTGVEVKFFAAAEFPGDGKPKPVAFPDPGSVAIEFDGIAYVDLATLIELKLAAGITLPGRLRHLADVQELMKVLKLDDCFVEKLNPYVRPTFLSLLEGLKHGDPFEAREEIVVCSQPKQRTPSES